MTVLEVLESCVGRVNSIRLPVAEAANMLQLAGIADDIQACINTLAAHAEEAAGPKDGEETEKPAEGAAQDPQAEAEAQNGAGDAQKAGEDDDERPDV